MYREGRKNRYIGVEVRWIDRIVIRYDVSVLEEQRSGQGC
jgi:hypothetical protein